MSGIRLSDMTSPEFRRKAKEKGTVIIPFGSLEAHGPHLPLSTDTFQVEAVALEAATRTGALMAPAVPYGVCLSTRDHPGTATISTGTLQGILTDLVRAFRRQGIRNFIVISGHAGKTHIYALRDAAERLLQEDGDLRIAVISEYDLILDAGGELLETADDRHAGELETSRMLALAPDLVRGTAPEEYPRFPEHILSADKVSHWPGSVWGNPGAADAAKGAKLLAISVDKLCAVIRELQKPGQR